MRTMIAFFVGLSVLFSSASNAQERGEFIRVSTKIGKIVGTVERNTDEEIAVFLAKAGGLSVVKREDILLLERRIEVADRGWYGATMGALTGAVLGAWLANNHSNNFCRSVNIISFKSNSYKQDDVYVGDYSSAGSGHLSRKSSSDSCEKPELIPLYAGVYGVGLGIGGFVIGKIFMKYDVWSPIRGVRLGKVSVIDGRFIGIRRHF